MKILRALLYSLVLFSFLLLIPIKVEAKEYTTNYYSVNEQNISFDTGELNFNRVEFKDYGTNFGLVGVASNYTNNQISYIAMAYFYNDNYELIGTSKINQSVSANNQILYNNIESSNSLYNNSKVSEITYFKVKIDTDFLHQTII